MFRAALEANDAHVQAHLDQQLALLETSEVVKAMAYSCLLYTSPSPRDRTRSRMPSSA